MSKCKQKPMDLKEKAKIIELAKKLKNVSFSFHKTLFYKDLYFGQNKVKKRLFIS